MSISLRVESWPCVSKIARTERLLESSLRKNPRVWASIKGRELASRVWREPFLTSQPATGQIEVVDLFCGCGGLSLGFEFLGRHLPSYRLAGAVDNDENCVSTYRRNLGIRPVLADLAAVARRKNGIEELISSFGLQKASLKVLLGGPPCQGFSAHQKKSGHNDDERNELVVAFSKFVKVLRPEAVVMENVPELFAKRFWHHFNKVRTTLTKEGYNVRAQILNLAGFGVPQARFRAVIIAMRKDFSMPTAFLEPSQFVTVREAISHLSPVNPGVLDSSDTMHFCTRHRESTVKTIRFVPKDGGRRPAGVGPKCLDTLFQSFTSRGAPMFCRIQNLLLVLALEESENHTHNRATGPEHVEAKVQTD